MENNNIPVPKMYIKIVSLDKDGNQIDGFDKRESHSWVRNGYMFMLGWFCMCNTYDTSFGAGYNSFKDTGGSIRNSANVRSPRCSGDLRDASPPVAQGVRASANDDSRGIFVGTSTAVESFEHYKLTTPIAHGVGAGQLSYQEHRANTKAWDAGTLIFTLVFQRYFNNSSGNTIVVNECGIALKAGVATTTDNKSYMLGRDVLDTGVSVVNSGQLIVDYYFEMQFPE